MSAVPPAPMQAPADAAGDWLLNAAQTRQLEQHAAGEPLMARAGAAAGAWAQSLRADDSRPILILAGPGNNGGDALVAAHWLWQRGHRVCPVFVGDVARLPADAANAHAIYLAALTAGVPALLDTWPGGSSTFSLIIDGLFGIGLSRPPEARFASLIAAANAACQTQGIPLLALDCPSGLDADTGTCPGAAIVATHTLSFLTGKPGLLTGDGPDHCGEVRIDALGLDLPTRLAAMGIASECPIAATATTAGRRVTASLFADQLQPRRRNTHKGTYGSAGILGGATGMAGAALLAGRAALALGTGRVFVGIGDRRVAVDFAQPELMLRDPAELAGLPLTALACGPGLGLSDAARDQLRWATAQALPLLLDADALSLLAEQPALLAGRTDPAVLTPHPAEAARLLATTTDAVQQDRVSAARTLAGRYRAVVVLKGCGSVIAHPDGRWWIDRDGTPALASAGTGDVLSGLITALLAQGWPADAATLAGVHLHSLSGQDASRAIGGAHGVAASALPALAARRFNALVAR